MRTSSIKQAHKQEMSGSFFDASQDSQRQVRETDGLIELQTLPRPIRRDTSKGIPLQSSNKKQTSMSSQKKPGLKQRIFGNRRNSKGAGKHDIVRNVEIVNYTQKNDRHYPRSISEKALEKPALWDFPTTFIMGHKMEQHQKPTWCDICAEFAWGLYSQAIRCQYCRYTCHAKCRKYINLQCPKTKGDKSREEITKETLEILFLEKMAEETVEDVIDLSESDGHARNAENNNLPDFVSSLSQLRRVIADYNKDNSLIMTLHENGTFDGFIRVQMNLSRPINISTDTSSLTLRKAVLRTKSGRCKKSLLSESRRPLSTVVDAVNSPDEDSGIESQSSASSTLTSLDASRLTQNKNKTRMNENYEHGPRPTRRLSFYLPKGTYKPLHVTSSTTAGEVIEALLTKYNVTDNPKKYALYEKYEKITHENNTEVTYRKLQDDDKPLCLRLSWGALCHDRAFALKEKEDGAIQWLNFELPELNNFMKILQIEEDELLAQIYNKYELLRHALEQAITDKRVLTVSSTDPPVFTSDSSNC